MPLFLLEVYLLNNTATEAKYNTTINILGVTGIAGSLTGLTCHAETSLRFEIIGVGPSNTIDIEGRIRNSPNWYALATATGSVTGTIDISTYDYIRYNVTNADGTGVLLSLIHISEPTRPY